MTPSEPSSPTIPTTVKPPPPIDVWIGRKVKNYVIQARLGQGGMGVVYLAEDERLKRPVAIKLIAEALTHEPKMLDRFVREARAAARLQHPNVVSIHEIDRERDTHYLVMEYVPGSTAQQLVDREGALRWRVAVQIIAEACKGLCAAHKSRLIHRDIKPGNLLVSNAGDVKLGDFGLAKFLSGEQTSFTQGNMVVGTPQYMSPEQAKSEDLDERSDLYSLGATFYTLLTGQPPFAGKDLYATMYAHATLPVPDPRHLVADIPAACVKIVQKAMAKSRADRFADAGEMLADLTETLGGRPEPLAPMAKTIELPRASGKSPLITATVTPQPRRTRNRWAAGLTLAMALILIGVALAIRYAKSPARTDDPSSITAADSVEQLKRDLIARNPRFDGNFTTIQQREERVVKLAIRVDHVTDIAPLGELTELEDLDLFTSQAVTSPLKDLTPLSRLQKVTRFRISGCAIDDFAFLKDWRSVTDLDLGGTKIKNAEILKEMPLVRLSLSGSAVQSLKGLDKLPIERLDLGYAYGLRSLEGLPTRKLHWLCIASTQILNLEALRAAGELQYLDLHWTMATRSQRQEMPRRSLHPDDMATLWRLKQLTEVIGEFTPAEEVRLRKELPSLRVVKSVPPGKSP